MDRSTSKGTPTEETVSTPAPRLQAQLRQRRPFAGLEEEVFLNLQRTANLLQQNLTQVLRPHRLTPTQYNVLRILRGSHPDALPCGEVGRRMVTPVPDVTRLLDRLEAHGWVERQREVADRRVVTARITVVGLQLVGSLDEVIESWLRAQLGHLGQASLQRLSRLLEAARAPLEE